MVGVVDFVRFFTKICLIFSFCSLNANASELPITSFTLKNGLEVIVVENHRVPAVNHTLWYRVGASDDPAGKSGLAHYHEHSMFLGTSKYKSGEYSGIITANGGEQNAFTGHDATAYFINIAKEKLPLAMEMEADRMRGLVLSNEDMAKEKQVIIEERRMRIENNPEALLNEQIEAALFRNHPYHTPTIGWMSEMYGLTKADVIDFHSKYYHPNNAILIVAGDAFPDEVKKLAEKYYGDFPKIEVPKRVWNVDPPQIAERKIIMHDKQVNQSSWSRVYVAPSLGDGNKEQVLPLFVLAQVLGGGKTSKLYKALVTEQKIATSVNVGYNGLAIGAGEFSIDITPSQNVDVETIEKAADTEIAKFMADGVSDDELARAKTLLKAETIFARDGLSEIANIVGELRMIGMPASYFSSWGELVDKVSKEQILQAAKDTMRKEASVSAALLPEEEKKQVAK